MSKLKKLYVLSAMLMVLMAPRISPAVDLFDTTGSSGITSGFFSPPLWAATLFHTTATDFAVASFTFQRQNTELSGNLFAKIYTNNAGKPGTQVGANLGTIDMSTVTTSFGLSGLNSVLAPNTTYWLVFDNSSVTGVLNLNYSESPTGVGSLFSIAQTLNSGASWSAFSGSALIGVITAVPEPGTIVMGIASVGVLAFAGYRRRGKIG